VKLLYIGIAVPFILSPVLGITDVLPDFIGCFLIMAGIRDAAYMIEKLASARKWFGYAAILSMIRFAVSFMNVESQHTLPLTLAFCFAVVELIVYIPAFRDLFGGFDYAAMRHGGSGVLSLGKKMGYYTDESGNRQYGEIEEDTTGKLAAASQRFILLRAAVSLLPELPALQLTESKKAGVVTGFQFSSISTLIKLVSFIVVLIPAVILLVKYIRFIRRIEKVGDFIPAVNAEIRNRFADLDEMHTCSKMRTFSIVAGIAVVLYMGMYDYQINIIPRYYCAAVLALSAVMLFAVCVKKPWNLIPMAFAAAAVPLSVRTFALQTEHYRIYKIQMLNLFESGNEYFYARDINEMNDEYLRMAIAESLEAIVLGLGLVLLVLLYMRTVVDHARTFVSVKERLRDELVVSLKTKGLLMTVAVSLSAAYFTAYRFILPYFDSAPMVGIGVNVLAAVMLAVFAVEANGYVYGNLHGSAANNS